MSLIIDDDNVCEECGAYITDLGYCANGHIQLVKRSIEDLTLNVGMLRAKLGEQRELVNGVRDRLEESDVYKKAMSAADMVRTTEAELSEAEAITKIAIEIHNEDTGEKKGFGWQVKEFKTIKYEEADALEWARQRPITANLISLKKSPFEKAAKALIDTGMEEAPDFVTLGTEKRVQLTKELG